MAIHHACMQQKIEHHPPITLIYVHVYSPGLSYRLDLAKTTILQLNKLIMMSSVCCIQLHNYIVPGLFLVFARIANLTIKTCHIIIC